MARSIGARGGSGTLGGRLTALRVARGLTQEALAEAAGTSQAVVQRVESGKCAHPRILPALARVLETSPAWLLYGVETIPGLEGEAVELARAWDRLGAAQRARLRALLARLERDAAGARAAAIEPSYDPALERGSRASAA